MDDTQVVQVQNTDSRESYNQLFTGIINIALKMFDRLDESKCLVSLKWKGQELGRYQITTHYKTDGNCKYITVSDLIMTTR